MNKIYYERPKHLQNRENTNNQNLNKQVYIRKTVNIPYQNEEPYMSMEEQEQQYYQPSYEAPIYQDSGNFEVKKHNVIKAWIANGVLIVLSISLVISLVILFGEISAMNHEYTTSESSFWYSINAGHYSDLVRTRHDNEARGVFETSGLKECYAIADYFEAASLYRVAVYTNDTEGMEKYLNKMETAYMEMEDVSYIAEEINMKLGLE